MLSKTCLWFTGYFVNVYPTINSVINQPKGILLTKSIKNKPLLFPTLSILFLCKRKSIGFLRLLGNTPVEGYTFRVQLANLAEQMCK